MTKEETLKRIEIMQAYCNGSKIQILTAQGWQDIENPNWNGINYRIKPSSEYRSFLNKEEYIQEAQKHPMPGWVKINNSLACIISITDKNFIFMYGEKYSYEQSLRLMTFVDGSPLGILINN